MPYFKHRGKIGDIIFSLPFVEAKGGGVYYIDLSIGLIGQGEFEAIKPLLENQDYVEKVEIYEGQKVDFDLSFYFDYKILADRGFEGIKRTNLVNHYLLPYSMEPHDPNKRWIKKIDPVIVPGKSFAVSLSPRYFNSKINWGRLLEDVLDQSVFIGLRGEWVDFCQFIEKDIDFIETSNFLQIQAVLEGMDRLFCGQGGVHALAEAIKMPLTLCIEEGSVDCLFPREGAEYLNEFN